MSSLSTISTSIIKRSIPFYSHKSVSTTKIPSNTPILLRKPTFPPPHISARDPPEYPSWTPPEFPDDQPCTPLEVPITTEPEIEPGGTPAEVIDNPPPYSPEPKPEIEFPKPPPGGDPPPGPDIMPPTTPGLEIDPPRTPPSDVPPVTPPGPEIVPPPTIPQEIERPPGSVIL